MKSTVSKVQQVLNVWAVVLILWSIYRTQVATPGSEFIDEFIAKPLVFIIPPLLYIHEVEKKDLFPAIWLKINKVKGDLLVGIALGSIFLAASLMANYVRTGSSDFIASFTILTLLNALAITLVTAFSEEILSRGFLLKRLYEDSKNVYSSSFLASILFLVLHIPVLFTMDGLSGSILLLFLATDFILSLVNSFIFLDRESLVGPILIHAMYNLAIILYI